MSNDTKQQDSPAAEPSLSDVLKAVQGIQDDMTDIKGRVGQLEAREEIAKTPAETKAEDLRAMPDEIRAMERRKELREKARQDQAAAAEAVRLKGSYEWHVSVAGSKQLLVRTDTPNEWEAIDKYNRFCGIRSTMDRHKCVRLWEQAEDDTPRLPGMPDLASATR